MYKKLSKEDEERIVKDVKMLLHASRDCLRNQGVDTTKVRFDYFDSYYSEAFGVFRCLGNLNYGTIYRADNFPSEKTNFKWWLDQLRNEVLQEENFKTTHECDYCLKHFGKDGAGRNRHDQNK